MPKGLLWASGKHIIHAYIKFYIVIAVWLFVYFASQYVVSIIGGKDEGKQG